MRPEGFGHGPPLRGQTLPELPGNQPERLARGDGGRPYDVTDLPHNTAPSGLVALPNGDLALCGVVSGTLDRYRHEPGGHWKRIGTIASRCHYGVARLDDGRLAYADRHAIRVVRPEGERL